MQETTGSLTGADGNRLAYSHFVPPQQEALSGAPEVLFMHGGGQTRHSWEGAARQIGSLGLAAWLVDARGHGESEWVANGDYRFESFFEDLRTIANDLRRANDGIPPILVGASLGGISGMVAQAGGSDEPGTPLFSAIILVDITPRMERSGVDKIMGFMAQNATEGFGSVEEAADAIAAYLPHRKRPSSNAGLKKNLRLKEDGRWYWHWDPRFVKGDMPIETGTGKRRNAMLEAVTKINVPTLLVRGGQSELVSREAVDEFLELVPHAKFVDVSGAGHMVAGDRNDAFAGAVTDFLRETVLRTV